MNRRILILLLLVIVLVVIGGAVFLLNGQSNPGGQTGTGGTGSAQVTAAPTDTPVAMTQVVVSVNNILRGSRIPEGNAVALLPWPAASVPSGALTETKQAIGRIARTDIPPGQVVVAKLLVNDLSQLARVGSDAALIVPTGYRAISVPMDRLTSVAYAIQDGDYVDVIISFLFVDVDPGFQSLKPNKISILTIKQDGTIEFSPAIQGEIQPSNFSTGPLLVQPTEPQRPRLVTQTTIKQAFVVHVGNFPLDGNFLNRATPLPTPTEPEGAPTKAAPPPTPTPPIPDVVTLAVSPQAAVELAWAIESRIPMTLVLRNPTDNAMPQTAEVTLQYIIDHYNVTQPSALPYSLEPALRSIRSMVIGNEVSLSGK